MVSAENAVNCPGVVNIKDLKFIAPKLLMAIVGGAVFALAMGLKK
jgi:hypothetical protein